MLNRKQLIKFNNKSTRLKIIWCGVLQGSILSFLIFIIFVNILEDSNNLLDPIMIFDDNNLFCMNENVKTLFETANDELQHVHEWFRGNKPSLY